MTHNNQSGYTFDEVLNAVIFYLPKATERQVEQLYRVFSDPSDPFRGVPKTGAKEMLLRMLSASYVNLDQLEESARILIDENVYIDRNGKRFFYALQPDLDPIGLVINMNEGAI